MKPKTKSSATKEEARPALVPKLRFPEFRGTGNWTTGTLGSVAKISTEKVGDNACIPMSITSGVGLVSQMEKFGRIIAGSSYANYLLLKKNDFAYNKSATKEFPEGFIALYSGDELAAVPNSIFTCFRIKGESPVPQYLNYLFLGNLHGKWLRKFIEVGARAHGSLSINDGDLLALPVPLPNGETTVAEQQKIAECLSSVDELIAAQARKVDALKTHKKGLMQQLFPRAGETQPRLRFPEFQNVGDWVVKPLGSLTSFSSGGTPSKDNPAYWNGSIPWISASSMYDLIIEKADHYVTPLAIGNGTRIAKKGSILILVRGSMLFNRVPICVAGIDVAFNQDVKALDVDASINTSFLLYQLSAFQSRIPINETGIGAGKIELEHLKEFELFFPAIPEQQRIASCLNSLDALITGETQKFEALKLHKRGLMQQLFPSPEEVEA